MNDEEFFDIPANIVGRADQLQAMIDDLQRIAFAQLYVEAEGNQEQSRIISAALGYVLDQVPQADLKPMIVCLLGMTLFPESQDSES